MPTCGTATSRRREGGCAPNADDTSQLVQCRLDLQRQIRLCRCAFQEVCWRPKAFKLDPQHEDGRSRTPRQKGETKCCGGKVQHLRQDCQDKSGRMPRKLRSSWKTGHKEEERRASRDHNTWRFVRSALRAVLQYSSIFSFVRSTSRTAVPLFSFLRCTAAVP